MIKATEISCCGCGACESVCGHKAIKITTDELGFVMPEVDSMKCVDCGLCDRLCPMLSERKTRAKGPRCFAARNLDISEVETSRSGAIFPLIYELFVRDNGVVYGAGFDDNFRVVHKRATTAKDCKEFKGSKYAQSDATEIYKSVRKDLAEGFKVLFSGTPCQIYALNNYIPHKLKERLLTVDIICHGVAAPKVWSDYTDYIEKKEGHKIVSANFRDKQIYGWDGLHRESFVFDNKKQHTYPITFYQPFLIRKACHQCRFCSIYRESDITLGDLWNWESVCKEMNADGRGVSMVMCNTEKGEKTITEISQSLQLKELDMADCMQHNLEEPTAEDPRRIEFANFYPNHTFDQVIKQFWPLSMSEKVKYCIKRIIGKA